MAGHKALPCTYWMLTIMLLLTAAIAFHIFIRRPNRLHTIVGTSGMEVLELCALNAPGPHNRRAHSFHSTSTLDWPTANFLIITISINGYPYAHHRCVCIHSILSHSESAIHTQSWRHNRCKGRHARECSGGCLALPRTSAITRDVHMWQHYPFRWYRPEAKDSLHSGSVPER